MSCLSLRDEDVDEQPRDKREFQESGSVKWATYKKYFTAARNPFLLIVVFLAFVGAETTVSGLSYFLSEW